MIPVVVEKRISKVVTYFQDYEDYDALGLAELVRNGEVSARTLMAEARIRLERINPVLNTAAGQLSAMAEQPVDPLMPGSLFGGVPFLINDLMLPFRQWVMRNDRSAMSRVLEKDSSTMVEALNRSGLVAFGRAVISETGVSPLQEAGVFGEAFNPWYCQPDSGGSSGNSSAIVAARVVPMVYSTDCGGSIRVPAASRGVFGFKPSPGLNRYEDMPGASGSAVVSHVSTLSVRDSAAYLDMVSGRTGADYNSESPPLDSYLSASGRTPRKLNIALITEAPTGTPVDSESVRSAEMAARCCEALGHQVAVERWCMDGRALMHAFLTVVLSSTCQHVADLARLWGMPERRLSLELTTRFMAEMGRGVSADALQHAYAQWDRARAQFTVFYQRYDLILTPVAAVRSQDRYALDPDPLEAMVMCLLARFGLGRKLYGPRLLDEIIETALYQAPFTPVANATAMPAMSVPLYWSAEGVPCGAHFMAAPGDDRLLFELAGQIEEHYPWRHRKPEVATAQGG